MDGAYRLMEGACIYCCFRLNCKGLVGWCAAACLPEQVEAGDGRVPSIKRQGLRPLTKQEAKL